MRLFGISTSVLVMAAFTNSASAQDLGLENIAPLNNLGDLGNLLDNITPLQDALPTLPHTHPYTFPIEPIKPYIPRLPDCFNGPVNPVMGFGEAVNLSLEKRKPCETSASINAIPLENKLI